MSKETLQIDMSQGIANPPQVNVTNGNAGAIILRPVEKLFTGQDINSGKMSYAQNVNVQNDKYGREIILPGPFLKQFTTTSAGIYFKAINIPNDRIYLCNSSNGILDEITSIGTGETPVYFGNNKVVTTTTAGISDMSEGLSNNANVGVYVVFVTYSIAWIKLYTGISGASVELQLSTPIAGAPLPILKAMFDNYLYIGNGQVIDKVNTTVTFDQNAITKGAVGTGGLAIPLPWLITAMGEWNGKVVAATCDTSPADFSQRNADAHSRLFFWDLANSPASNYLNIDLISPSHYISVLLNDLTGNLLAFGGVDEGRTTIYQFNGYGFNPIFSYIGDMPRNRHSVCFDSVGRLVWVTADSKLCRWDKENDIFDILAVVGTNDKNGGICTNFQAGGNDFLVAGDTWVSAVDLNNFVAGGSGTTDTIARPIAISGLKAVPQQSVITNVTPTVHKALQTGETIEVRLYPSNYNATTYTVLGNMSFAVDGAITSKNIRTLQPNQTQFSIGYVWETTATNTAPGIISTNVEYKTITTL